MAMDPGLQPKAQTEAESRPGPDTRVPFRSRNRFPTSSELWRCIMAEARMHVADNESRMTK